MAKIRLTKEFNFEAAHALWNYDGKCKNLHGHSYRLFVTVIGDPIVDKTNTKRGMVIDFGDLKTIVSRCVIDLYDHAVIFNSEAPYAKELDAKQVYEQTILLNYQPTCENMVLDFANTIQEQLPSGVELHSLKLYETAKSFAEWYAEDNK